MYISRLPGVVVSAFKKNTEQMILNEDIRPIFPFTAIIGQDEMKLSLILNIIDPKNRRRNHYGRSWNREINHSACFS